MPWQEHRLGVRAALVDGTEVPGDVAIADGRIAEVGCSPAGRSGLAVPGLVDLQVNGAGGVDLLDAGPDEVLEVAAALATHGVSAWQPTLVSAPEARLAHGVRAVAAALETSHSTRILGVHLEGPFLSPGFPGVHDVACLRDPDTGLVDRLMQLGPVSMVTLAPELAGGVELVTDLSIRGVVASIGHSDAGAEDVHAAITAGARALTHVWNAHRLPRAREPGPAGVALTHPSVSVMVIADGVHVAPELLVLAAAAAGERLCAVSDLAGASLGGRPVEPRDGAARLAGTDTLAGGSEGLDGALRRLVALGLPLAAAVHATSAAPAALLGREEELGTLRPGATADVAVLDDGLRVVRTVVGGQEAYAAS
jgi:N-acetylglucosamine-6-phosphate deacetylase